MVSTQEPLALSAPIGPDAATGIGVLKPVAPGLSLVQHGLEDFEGAVGGTRSRAIVEIGKPPGHIGFVKRIDEDALKGIVEIDDAIAGLGVISRRLPARAPFCPIFDEEVVEARRRADALAVGRRVLADCPEAITRRATIVA